MTPLDEFRKLVPEGYNLTEEQLIAMRDLVDAQADMILEAYIVKMGREHGTC